MPSLAPSTLAEPLASIGRRDAALDLLKWLALLAMLLDHLRHVWPSLYGLYAPGRLAFPFFCLAIAVNLLRPADAARRPLPWRYLALLLGFSLVSEWPYRLLAVAPPVLNVMPTLALGLVIANGWVQPAGRQRGLAWAAVLLALLADPWLMFGFAGALLPLAFVQALRRPGPLWAGPVVLCLLANYWPQFYADGARGDAFSLIVIAFCAAGPLLGLLLVRRQPPFPVPPVGRWAYLFYPAHFLVLVAIRTFA